MAGERIPFRALVVLAIAGIVAGCADKSSGPPEPATPIEHVIVVVGENQSFDALFGTYDPPAGEQVWNLRSRGIVDANGLPGPSFAKAAQQQAEVLTRYEISPVKTGAYATLPQPNNSRERSPTPGVWRNLRTELPSRAVRHCRGRLDCGKRCR